MQINKTKHHIATYSNKTYLRKLQSFDIATMGTVINLSFSQSNLTRFTKVTLVIELCDVDRYFFVFLRLISSLEIMAWLSVIFEAVKGPKNLD